MFSDFSKIFSCSDLNHQVINPAMLLLGQILTQAPISCPQDGLVGIYLCQIIYSVWLALSSYILVYL
jgi:hypothetical protein